MIETYFEVAGAIPQDRCQVVIAKLYAGEQFTDAIVEANLSSAQKSLLQRLISLTSALNPSEIAKDLEYAYMNSRQLQDVRVAWTGPAAASVKHVRATFPVAKTIVGRAMKTLIIAGYIAQSDVLERLGFRGAIKRGAEVILLLDKADLKSLDVDTMIAAGAKVVDASPYRSGMAKFHVKAIVADSNEALVTSANFTHLGHAENIELGTWVRGQPAALIDTLLRHYYDTILRNNLMIQ